MGQRRKVAVLSVVMGPLLASVAAGTVPVGPPLAGLEEGRWAIGLEYGYGEIDLHAYGTYVTAMSGVNPVTAAELLDIRGLRTNTILGNLAYGVCDNWDLFLRLGLADAQDDVIPDRKGRFRYGGGHGLAWGAGTRATFCQWGPWSFGGSAQVTWLYPGDSDFTVPDPDTAGMVWAGSADLELWQTQVSLAVAYQIDTLHFWAGPFLQFVEGQLDRGGRILIDGVNSGSFRGSSDIEEQTQVGIHLGAGWEMSDNLSWWLDGRFGGDSWSIGLGAALQPERLFPRR
jgi:hypothetical protein